MNMHEIYTKSHPDHPIDPEDMRYGEGIKFIQHYLKENGYDGLYCPEPELCSSGCEDADQDFSECEFLWTPALCCPGVFNRSFNVIEAR